MHSVGGYIICLLIQNLTSFSSGIPQGKLIKRQRLPKNDLGEYWHWKDLNLGINVTFYGKVFHICDCDAWTRVRIFTILRQALFPVGLVPCTFNRRFLSFLSSLFQSESWCEPFTWKLVLFTCK